MRIPPKRQAWSILATALIFAAGCARSVRIDSEPRARVSLDGSFTGYTPLDLDLGSGVRELRLESDGYETVEATLRRGFDPRSLWAVPVFPLLLFPALSTRLGSEYHVELRPGEGRDPRRIIEPLAPR